MITRTTLLGYFKAVAPAFLTLAAVVIHGFVTGEVDRVELEIGMVGFLSSLLIALISGTVAKALIPALLTLISFGVHYAITEEFNRTEVAGALTGLLAAVVALLVPNTVAGGQAPGTLVERQDRSVQ